MNRLKNLVNNFPFYILFFSWYSILFLYSSNFSKLSSQVIIKPLLIITVICLSLWGIFTLIFKRSARSGILIGSLLLITFMYEPIRQISYFNNFNIGSILIKWSDIYLFFSLVLLISTIGVLMKSQKEFKQLNKILNIGGLTLMILVIIPLIYKYTMIHFGFNQDLQDQAENFSDSVPSSNSTKKPAVKPDIYYIIPEDYGSSDTLKDYGLDNNKLITYLKAHHFYIAAKSKTNYPFSTFAIAAALNMDYLNSHTFPQIKTQPGGVVIDNALQNSKVLNFIKSQGYSYFHIGSWYQPLRYNDLADINFTYDTKLNLDEFSDTLLHNTIFYPLVLNHFGVSGGPNHIANTLYQYKTLADMPNQISPKFVFVDILSPHSPYIFGPNCNNIQLPPKDQQINNFLKQVRCVNKKLISIIDTILKNSATPPIIIIQTDEGPKDNDNQALKYPDKTGAKGAFKDASLETDLERVKILNAFYLPGSHKNMLYPQISPVNTFRLVFDEYFNAKLPLLPDKVYTFDDYDKLYKFIFNDITKQVKDN